MVPVIAACARGSLSMLQDQKIQHKLPDDAQMISVGHFISEASMCRVLTSFTCVLRHCRCSTTPYKKKCYILCRRWRRSGWVHAGSPTATSARSAWPCRRPPPPSSAPSCPPLSPSLWCAPTPWIVSMHCEISYWSDLEVYSISGNHGCMRIARPSTAPETRQQYTRHRCPCSGGSWHVPTKRPFLEASNACATVICSVQFWRVSLHEHTPSHSVRDFPHCPAGDHSAAGEIPAGADGTQGE